MLFIGNGVRNMEVCQGKSYTHNSSQNRNSTYETLKSQIFKDSTLVYWVYRI